MHKFILIVFKIFYKKDLLTAFLENQYANKCIGFVPTMGALHQGHLSLIAESYKNNSVTVVSIFVNPTQFTNQNDLENYPRTLQADIKKISDHFQENIIVYAPNAADVYDQAIKSKSYKFGGIEHQMEGKFRKGHFDGVATVVEKLFGIVKPTLAYFGEKDFQQLQIIKKLVETKKLNIQIVGCKIYREINGLAMSSRNERLSKKSRENAKIIYETLQTVKEHFDKKSVAKLQKMASNLMLKHPEMSLEYFEIANENTLKTAVRKVKNKSYRAFIAVYVDNIRLIDNIKLN